MKKNKTIIIFCFLIFYHGSFAQNLLIKNSDTTYIKGDSVLLTISKTNSENILWQLQKGKEWIDIIQDDSLLLKIDSSNVYRAIILKEKCAPKISDTIYIKEKIIENADNNQINFDDRGGSYVLPGNQIKIKIPSGTVNIPSQLTFNTLSYNELIQNTDSCYYCDLAKTFVYGFSVAGDNPLQSNIKLVIANDLIKSSDMLFLYRFDPDNNIWRTPESKIIYNPSLSYIEITISDYGSYSVFAYNYKNSDNTARLKDKDDCKNGITQLTSSETDFQSNNGGGGNEPDKKGCYIATNNGKVVYLDCGITEGYEEHNFSQGCKLSYKVYLQKNIIKVGEQTKLIVEIKIGSHPLPNQLVSIAGTEGVEIINTNPRLGEGMELTDKEGKATFIIEGINEDLKGVLAYKISYLYYRYSIMAYDQNDKNAFQDGLEMGEFPLEEKKIIIYDKCTSPDELDCSYLDDGTQCETVKKNELIAIVDIYPENQILKEDESKKYNVDIYNSSFKKIEYPPINWTSSNNDVAFVLDGEVKGVSPGNAVISARVCEKQKDLQVEVLEKDKCEDAVLSTAKHVKIQKNATYKLKYTMSPDPDFIPPLSFKSLKPDIASINENGLITGHKPGTAEMIITWCETKSVNIAITIEDDCQETKVVLSPANLEIEVKEHYPVEISYDSPSEDNIFIPLIKWKSEDPSIATVTDMGVVYGVKPGSTRIIAYWCSDSTIINIKVNSVSCSIDPFQSKCNGQIESPWIYMKFYANSSGGTFHFIWDLRFKIIYKIESGEITQKYIDLTGKYYYNWIGWVDLDRECDFTGSSVSECLNDVKFEVFENLDELKGSVKVTCTKYKEQEKTESFKFFGYF